MSRIIGCGIDIEELDRFQKHLPVETNSRGFWQMVMTEAEIDNNLHIAPHLTFPLSFSCKEAAFKAFGMSWTNSRISWKDIGIFFTDPDDLSQHIIRLNGYALELFHEMGCKGIESSFECKEDFILFQVFLLS
ncbi:MAG: 4'-phosphopantetheinyl transferase superfamily protein [Bacteroidales bacterium]|nr:4'-phosphopantetheinyl transferase superfamily protein [Bacteroidales bacterium]